MIEDTNVPELPARLEEADRLALEVAKQKRFVALAQAERAIVANEKAELEYKYVVLQLYMKNGLTSADAISEDGLIIKGGAKVQPNGEGK